MNQDIKTTEERIEEATREIGVLLIAFAPLDVALSERHELPFLFLFLGLGILMFTLSLWSERRRAGDPPSNRLLILGVLGLSLMGGAAWLLL